MQRDKYLGSDGLPKEFYEKFWKQFKEMFVDSLSEGKGKGPLSTS